MFIDNEETFDAACDLILTAVPTIGAVSTGYGENDGVSFSYKGLRYEFYDFVELIEFTTKALRKANKAKAKEVKTLRKQALLQATLLSGGN